MTGADAPENGWHWPEWVAEFVGTGVLLFAVVTAKDLAVRAGPPFGDLPWRVVIVAVVAGLAVLAIAISPLGRRSGAHLNPAVTLGFWCQRTVAAGDLTGYCLAQSAGGVTGVALAAVWGPSVASPDVRWALIAPGEGFPTAGAAGLELAATGLQLALVYALLSSRRLRRAAPAAAAVSLAVAIVVLAPTSGAGFNPVRALAPDVLAGAYPAWWVYVVGPLLGSVAAALVLRAGRWRPLTGKLHHDPSITCHMHCELPHAPAARPHVRARA
jgi:aquaporin Z